MKPHMNNLDINLKYIGYNWSIRFNTVLNNILSFFCYNMVTIILSISIHYKR